MQFTFTFPPLLWFGYQVMTDAMIEDKAYSPGNGNEGRIDTWKDWSRWKRVKDLPEILNVYCPDEYYRDSSVDDGISKCLILRLDWQAFRRLAWECGPRVQRSGRRLQLLVQQHRSDVLHRCDTYIDRREKRDGKPAVAGVG